jgi:hypothetical protein
MAPDCETMLLTMIFTTGPPLSIPRKDFKESRVPLSIIDFDHRRAC